MVIKDIANQTFGKLTAIERVLHNGKYKWKCICSCGNPEPVYVYLSNLTRLHTTSCGCNKKSFYEHSEYYHGQSDSRLNRIWRNMKTRCLNPNSDKYNHYGGRGICICDEWQNSFVVFMEWSLSNGYSDELTLDRIDVNGNYEPSNCRWITQKEQAFNKRNNVLISMNGESHTLKEWCSILNLSYSTMVNRIYRKKIDPVTALNTPVRKKIIIYIEGETDNLRGWCKTFGLNYKKVHSEYLKKTKSLNELLELDSEVEVYEVF